MKKQIVLTAIVAFLGFATVNAQGFQRRTVEERVKAVHEKLDSAFKLDAAKMKEAEAIFTDYYKAQDKAREDAMAGGGQPDRDAMRAKNQELAGQRDDKLKKVLSEDQMKIWKDQIEPSMRPQRGNRPPGGQK
ncbi:MAG: hypothetical protein ABJA78_00130 [Ferruginibacter sp.]